MQLAIALIQFSIAPLDPELNLARMETFIRLASKQGAQLVVFPEDSITGPLDGQTAFVAQAATYLATCQAFAIKYEVDLVPGTWSVSDGAALYNTAYYINKDGTIAGSYRKIHLWKTEKGKLTPGKAVSVFPTAHGLVGLIICWDVSFPLLFTEMVKRGARLVLSPSYWSFPRSAETEDEIDDEILLIDSLCITRAFDNNVVFAYCNAAGELKVGDWDAVLSGRSQVTHPLDKVICKSAGNDEELLFSVISID